VGTYRIPRVDLDLTGQAIGDFARRFGRPFLKICALLELWIV
jgi:hypothetical protein